MKLSEAKKILKRNGYLIEDATLKNSLSYNGPKVKIGSQVWAAKNLDVDDGGEGIYEHNGEYYYTWEAAMRVADKIPGWHLPTKEEFKTLFEDASGYKIAGQALKSTEGWKKDGNGTDEFGFNALPAGYRGTFGHFNDEGYSANFWSSSEGDSKYSFNMDLYYSYSNASLNVRYKDLGYSVRLVKD